MKKVVEQKSQFASGVLMNSGDLNCDGFPDLLYKYTTLSGAKSISIEFGTKDGFQGNGARSIKIMNSEIDGAIPSLNQYVSGIKIIPDINGDGCADLIVSLMYLKNSGVVTATDAAYVIFGDKNLDKLDIDISKIAMPRGFLIAEANPVPAKIITYDAYSLGDINQDGSNDFSITREEDEFTYLIFGRDKKNPFTNLKLSGNTKDWFKVDNCDKAIGIGDINGDGYKDFAMNRGSDTYVMYGLRTGFYDFKPADAKATFWVYNLWQ